MGIDIFNFPKLPAVKEKRLQEITHSRRNLTLLYPRKSLFQVHELKRSGYVHVLVLNTALNRVLYKV